MKSHFYTYTYIVGISLFLAVLHLSHNYSFSAKVDKDFVDVSQDSSVPHLVHVLGEGCGCSEFVEEYLLERKPKFNEYVVSIGEISLGQELSEAGYTVINKQVDDPALASIEGLPFFYIHHSDQLLYLGGYSSKMINQHTKMEDLAIYEQVVNGNTQESLPVFGCARSRELQRKFDPLSLKY